MAVAEFFKFRCNKTQPLDLLAQPELKHAANGMSAGQVELQVEGLEQDVEHEKEE